MSEHLKKTINVIIPSAKLIPEELQGIGKLPSVIYPVNDKIVFDFLYSQYNGLCDRFKILCYEEAQKVHAKLSLYKNENIEVIDITELKDLAHTIYFGLDDDQSVIINFGDTIVMDDILENQSDCFYYSEDYISEKWTYYRIENGRLEILCDKKTPNGNYINEEKLFVGVFYLSDSSALKKCMEYAFEHSQGSTSLFFQALKLYSEIHPLNEIKTSNWFDIGHADEYFNSRLEVKAREFNHITIDKNRGILTKTSDTVDKFIGEIKWYLKLPADVEYVRPRIFSYSTDYENPYVCMEYYAYHTIHELYLNGALDMYQWEKIFKRIKFIIDDLKRYRISDEKILASLEDMYITKTILRLEKIKKGRFKSFFTDKIIVNGVAYQDLDAIVLKLKNVIPSMLYDVKEFTIIHGDLCFSNMMIDSNFSFIKVIDPRGKFGSFDMYGDSRYELAKLFHSVDGKYDYIIKDRFELCYNGNNVDFTIQDKNIDFNLYDILLKVFKEEIENDLEKIELIEALLFLSMVPLHNESFEHQLVMLGTGLEILDRVIDIKNKGD